jgi:hypothetical protein
MLNAQPQPYSILQRKEVPDGLLVGQALTGDQYAFELLVNRYQQQLVSHIQGFLKDHDQCYDILQAGVSAALSVPATSLQECLTQGMALSGGPQSLPG